MEAVPYEVEKTCRAVADLPLAEDFIARWQTAYRTGRLPARYGSIDVDALRALGYH